MKGPFRVVCKDPWLLFLEKVASQVEATQVLSCLLLEKKKSANLPRIDLISSVRRKEHTFFLML